MRLTVPPLEIEENEGFNPSKDIFNRKEFGEKLSNLIENIDEEIVIALEAPWGEGKTTFIKMWRGYLKKEVSGIESIYFNAFEKDYQNGAFLALAEEIYNLIDKKEKKIFKGKAASALKTARRLGVGLGVTAVSNGAADGVAVAAAVENLLELASSNKANIREFKKYLENLPVKVDEHCKRIIFIIDELDRCKPPFALEIIEIVKHLFSVPNITFLLVLNRAQLEASVKSEYGTEDASTYLQKFINLWIGLPKRNDINQAQDSETYFIECIKLMGMQGQSPYENVWIEMFRVIVVYYNLSFREIERCLTNFAFIRASLNIELNHTYLWISAYLSIIKVKYSFEYASLRKSKIDYSTLVSKTDLTDLVDTSYSIPLVVETHPLKLLLRYCLASDGEARGLEQTEEVKKYYFMTGIVRPRDRGAIKNVCKLLDSFQLE